MERFLSVMALLLLSVFLGFPGYAQAVSYPLIEEQREKKAEKGIREKGEIVCLFQSGTADVKKSISVGDLLMVYRERGKHEWKEVGKIKVLSYIGEDYLKGEVIEGEVRTGDIAKKGDVASLVISSEDKCK
jgi:hypothetical protein